MRLFGRTRRMNLSALRSVSAEHEDLEGQHQRLEAQNQSVHKCERVNNMKSDPPSGAGIFCDDRVMVAGIGISDATAPGRYIVDPTLVERLEKRQECAGARHLLDIDQLLPATK